MKTRKVINKTWQKPKFIFKVFLVFILVLYVQLCYLTLSPSVYGINMKTFASKRNTVKTILQANRGTIYDKDGNPLAISVTTYTLIAYLDASRTTDENNPQHVIDKELTASKLSEVLNLSYDYILERLNQDKYQVEFGVGGSNITELVKDEIKALELPGLAFRESTSRNYPNGDFASYIVGYAKKYNGSETINNLTENLTSLVGELGIEAKYNELLTGQNGYLEYQKDRSGYRIPDTEEIRVDAIDGSNIYLTIDSGIQRFVEASLKELENNYNPKWAVIAVMNAKTGEILASGSNPSYNPNDLSTITNYENPLVSYAFEPGSTMKIYTYMCAIEKGTYNGNETFKSGSYQIGDDIITDYNNVGWGTITYDTGFAYSSNVGAINVVNNFINKNELRNCLENYGFGSKTGIELSRELSGSIKFNYPVEVAAASYGQGITTTPVQHLQSLSIIANGGKMVKPHIVSKIVDPNTGKTTYEADTSTSARIVKEGTALKVRELMRDVILNNGPGATGQLYRINGVDLLGKTGTAQIFSNKTGSYLTGSQDYVYSFAGMFPGDDPEIIIYAAMQQPTHRKGRGIADATTSVIQSIVKYYNMNSNDDNDEDKNQVITVSSYLNQNVDVIASELEASNIKVIRIGDGTKVAGQYPESGSKIVSGDKVFLVSDGANRKLPDINGWSRADVAALCDLLGIKVTFEGYGYVTTYSPGKDTLITNDFSLNVVLSDKYVTKKE